MRAISVVRKGVETTAPVRRGALKVPKTSEMIADWLREYMRRHRLEPGDPLPTEEELKQRFSASRPSVREAMRILESKRLVRITRGATGGARYNVPDVAMVAEHAGIYLEAHKASQADLTEARLNIEPCIIGYIAETAPLVGIARLAQSTAHQLAQIDNPAAFAHEHEQFYEILAELCANITLSMHLLILRDLMRAQMAVVGDSLFYGGEQGRRSRRAHIRAKQKMVELLSARDRQGVERWWRKHLQAQMSDLVESGRGDAPIKAP